MAMRSKLIISGLLLAMASTTSLAFEETTGGVAPEQQAQSKTPTVKQPLNLEGTGTSIDVPPRSSSGTEVRIPGLGKLGVLPKFDFGLELLYGVDQQKPAGPDRGRSDQAEDMQIRGSIKHRF